MMHSDHERSTFETPRRPATTPGDWPAFHLAHPGPGWASPGDPNCAFYVNGTYHLHYIYDRGALDEVSATERQRAGQSDYAFAHVSSRDLVHWTWHQTTLAPARTGHGMFSGTGFYTKEGRPAMMYHGQGSGANYVAVAEDDDLEQWGDPVRAVVHLRDDQDATPIYHFDPDAWLERDRYFAIFGGGYFEGTAATYFTSSDLENWDYLGVFLDPDLPEAGDDSDIACANFFPIGGKHMLLCISHNRGCRYYLGEWKDDRFTPEFHGRMNWHAQDLFAPESVLTADGRRVMWAWINVHAPQSGIQSLPRELELPEDGVLRIRPLRELAGLRTDECREQIVIESGCQALIGIAGDLLELSVTMRPVSARRLGIRVRCDGNGGGGLPIIVDLNRRTLTAGPVTAPFEVHEDEIRLTVFVDKFLVEVFANDRQAIAVSHFPDVAEDRVAVVAEDGSADANVVAWRMQTIYDGQQRASL